MTAIICGVDVSSQFLDARIGPEGPHQRFENQADGVADLLSFCRTHDVGLVVMEATGGYERLALGLLWAADQPCAIVNPRAVRCFAEGIGRLEKTDRIDAGVIAWYAEVKRIVATPPASAEQDKLRALTTRLRQIGEDLVVNRNRARLVVEPRCVEFIAETIALLRRQSKEIEAAIAELVAADPLWTRLAEEFRAIKGVGQRTIAHLFAYLPEIGAISGKAISKLVGLAPIARDSGKSKGKRGVRGGRAPVRTILFTVASVVARWEPDYVAFRQRLKNAGKAPKVARTAVAHKLLVRLNAMARDIRAQLKTA